MESGAAKTGELLDRAKVQRLAGVRRRGNCSTSEGGGRSTTRSSLSQERCPPAERPYCSATAAETVTRVLSDVRAFAGGAKQSDDITVLAARYLPA